MTLNEVLRGHKFAAGLSDVQVETLAKLATEVHFAEDEVILLDWQRSTSFYFVVSGSVVVELSTPENPRKSMAGRPSGKSEKIGTPSITVAS